MSLPTELHPLSYPLIGNRLIEASAGTGKTYTIAFLYLRLVLGHGAGQEARAPLTPPEILVVTFTRAATRELRERIRSRLAEAAACFRAEGMDEAGWDPLLCALRADYPIDAWSGAARRLQLAAEWMDEAAVETIHGWCQRMLNEHAFEGGSLFNRELAADLQPLSTEVIRDYWRIHVVPLSLADASGLLDCWPDFDRLQCEVERLFRRVELLAPAEPLEAILAERRQAWLRLAQLKGSFARWLPEMRALLDEAVARKWVNGRKVRTGYYLPWLEALEAWRLDADLAFPAWSDAAWRRLTPEGLADAWNVGDPPAHPAFAGVLRLYDELVGWRTICHKLWMHAARWVAERFKSEKERLARLEFDDVLTHLEAGLRGVNGEKLAGLIRRQFPVALIDEFQDTDPVQYRIFSEIYRDPDGTRDQTALVLIGDPKQSIYAFRGADIHTYLTARRLLAGRIQTLGCNFRSSAGMVAAVNRLFAAAEERVGPGAFLHRQGEGDPIPFQPVAARGRSDRLEVDGEPYPAMTLAWSGESRDWMAEACASEMVRLLRLGGEGRAGFRAATGELTPLDPSDLAVLVGGRAEYRRMRAALMRRGVRSVYLSDQESVFASPCALELFHWLAACAAPEDTRLLRTAMATATLGVAWLEIDALARDERLLEARIRQFVGYREIWRRQGVLPMLRRLLHEFGVSARLLAGGGAGERSGERLLTDLLHLAELLGEREAEGGGESALLRFLDEALREAEEGAREESERLTRLESDAGLVRIVTVHKSKGLEYPLVFLPFAGSCRPVGTRDLPLVWNDESGGKRLIFTADEALMARLEFERLREESRRLYVALTRARHAVWVGVGVEKGFSASALHRLLGAAEGEDAKAIAARLATLDRADGTIQLIPAAEPNSVRFVSEANATLHTAARQARRRVRDPWWQASYSALLVGPGSGAAVVSETPESPGEARFRELALEQAGWQLAAADNAVADLVESGLHPFPRGTKAGSLLHDLLAWCGLRGFARVARDAVPLREEVARRLTARGWSAWIEPLCDWLERFITTPLVLSDASGVTCRPADLEHYQVEMEFLLAIEHLPVSRLDQWVRATIEPGQERPPLQGRALHGLLKGFMDLVFEHQGRYYLIDYKSTWLGPDAAAYTPEAMRAEMLHARHELQGVLYLYALHRQLRARLVDYQPERHLGGALFLFVRGLETEGQGIYRLRPTPGMMADLDALFGGVVKSGDEPFA
ncbi:MAG: exodeoxyribonuclease V subunit beta [Magnetococcus sp. YQC-9]